MGVYRPETRARISPITQTVMPIGNHGVVVSNKDGKEVVFTRTNRGLFDIRYERYFPKSYLYDESFADKKTLDLACGDGQLVEELRYRGHDLVGLDIHLTPYQKSKPYYVLADAFNTGFEDNTFDRILAIQGPLTYLFAHKEMREQLLHEAHRVLRPGGRILISPLPIKSLAELPPLPPGFRRVAWANAEWMMIPAENNMEEHANFWIELEKI
jgi:SAM-dependent methyltransferase